VSTFEHMRTHESIHMLSLSVAYTDLDYVLNNRLGS
jgi:hypothetical protein